VPETPDITTRHPAYLQAAALWWKPCRDTYAGEQAVRSAGVAYVPLLEGCDHADAREFKAYLDRGTFFPAVERTIIGLTGMVLRKPAQVKVPTSVDVESGITLYGEGLLEFVSSSLEELLVVGRAGVSVDWSETLNRPYWSLWRAESIVNWQARMESGQVVLDRVVLEDDGWVPSPTDPYKQERKCTYRELALMATEGGQKVAASRTWVETTVNGKKTYTPGPWSAFIRRGKPLPFIPFVFLGPRRPEPAVAKPPLLDLALLNLSHWRSSVDYEYGLHFTALPTPYVTGWTNNATPLKIGSGTAWVIPSKDARVAMLEFTGTGLGAVEKALDRKEHQMATVGARLLESQPGVQETAEAVRLRHAGETSALGLLARAQSMGLTQALRIHAWWQGYGDVDVDSASKVSIQLNTDFLETRLTAQELDSLVKAWQAGGISGKTLYWNLQTGEIARPNVEYEEERTTIEAEEPPDPAPVPGQPGQPTPPPEPGDQGAGGQE